MNKLIIPEKIINKDDGLEVFTYEDQDGVSRRKSAALAEGRDDLRGKEFWVSGKYYYFKYKMDDDGEIIDLKQPF